MDNVTVEFTGKNRGFASSNSSVMTFEIQGVSEREDIRFREFQSLYSKYATERNSMKLQEYTVPLWGEGHNLYPQEVYSVISENKLLPEVIEKQVRFIFGKGPRLYQERIVGEEDSKRRVRVPFYDSQIEAWLNSWEEKGYEHYWKYLRNIIVDYYHVKTCVTKYHFNRGRRVGAQAPISALSYVGADEARLAAKGDFFGKRIKNGRCRGRVFPVRLV